MLTPAHGGSLATTAGITSVITMVMAASLLGQCNGLTGPAQLLAAGTLLALVLGAGLLYSAREAIGTALDVGPGDAPVYQALATRGFALYHFGKACLFMGLALGLAWRLALPLGELGWLGVLAACGFAFGAAARGLRHVWPGGVAVPQSAAPKQ